MRFVVFDFLLEEDGLFRLSTVDGKNGLLLFFEIRGDFMAAFRLTKLLHLKSPS